MEEFANFDFNIWRKRYIQWISHLKSRILDVFRSIDRDQDGRISQKELIDYVLASSRTLLLIISMLKPWFMSLESIAVSNICSIDVHDIIVLHILAFVSILSNIYVM